MASEHIRADVVEVTEFPDVAMRYRISSVPNTIINEDHSVIGGRPEADLAAAVLQAIGV